MQRNVKLCRHQHHSHDLIQSTETTGIHLNIVQRFSLQKLLEHDTVLAMLASGDFDVVFAEGRANGCVAEDVIGGRGFLNEERFERGEVGEVSLCFGNGPDLG